MSQKRTGLHAFGERFRRKPPCSCVAKGMHGMKPNWVGGRHPTVRCEWGLCDHGGLPSTQTGQRVASSSSLLDSVHGHARLLLGVGSMVQGTREHRQMCPTKRARLGALGARPSARLGFQGGLGMDEMPQPTSAPRARGTVGEENREPGEIIGLVPQQSVPTCLPLPLLFCAGRVQTY